MYANVTTIKRFQMSSKENTPVRGWEGGGWEERTQPRLWRKVGALSPSVTGLDTHGLSQSGPRLVLGRPTELSTNPVKVCSPRHTSKRLKNFVQSNNDFHSTSKLKITTPWENCIGDRPQHLSWEEVKSRGCLATKDAPKSPKRCLLPITNPCVAYLTSGENFHPQWLFPFPACFLSQEEKIPARQGRELFPGSHSCAFSPNHQNYLKHFQMRKLSIRELKGLVLGHKATVRLPKPQIPKSHSPFYTTFLTSAIISWIFSFKWTHSLKSEISLKGNCLSWP